MGVSSDLVIADLSEITKIEESYNPVEDFGGVHCRIGMVSYWTLMDIISGGNDYIEKMEGFDLINKEAEESPEGPWVTTIHQDLRGLLYSLSEEKMLDVAEQWSQTEELETWDTADLVAAITDIVAAYKEADAKGKTLVLVNAL